MFVVWMVLIGFVVGAGARVVWRSRSYVTTTAIGLGGSVAAALLGRSVGWFRGPVGGGLIFVCLIGGGVALVIYGAALRVLAGDPR